MKISNNFLPNRFLIIALLLLTLGCSSDKKGDKTANTQDFKLEAKGGMSELIVVVNPMLWESKLGDALKEVFAGSIDGLATDEPYFSIIQIDPSGFKNFLQRHHSVVFVTVFNDNTLQGKRMKQFFTKESYQRLQKEEERFMLSKRDEFARGQKLLHLFGEDPESIIANLSQNKDKVVEFFKSHHRERLRSKILRGSFENKALNKFIKKEAGLNMRITNEFQVALEEENFIWLRKPGNPEKGNPDMSITISYGNYSSEDMFETEEIVKWRNHFGYKYMNDTTRAGSYMHTQEVMPVASKKVALNDTYAVEYRGLWMLKNKTRGGTFLGYAFVDEEKGRFYYVEGFVYAPNEKKRSSMFHLESLLRTAYTDKE